MICKPRELCEKLSLLDNANDVTVFTVKQIAGNFAAGMLSHCCRPAVALLL